jgi:multidrug resistance efflux pump
VNPRNKFWIILLVLTLMAATWYFATSDRTKDMVLIGTIDANQVIVSPQVAGRIVKLAVDEGTVVKQGDLIAQLDTSELEAQAKGAEATIRSYESRVGEAHATQEQTQGQTSSDVLNAQARLQAARSQLAQAEADAERQKTDTDRVVALAKAGVAAQQQSDEAVAMQKSADARVQAARDQVRSADADLAAARARIHQQTAAVSNTAAVRQQVAQAQAQLDQARTRLGYTKIVAPVSGVVSVRAVREGEVVQPGSPVVTIMDLGQTWVRAAIAETYADKIALGDTLKVRLPSQRVIDGKVIVKQVEGDFATQRDFSQQKRDIRTVALRLLIDNPRAEVVPGMTAEVLIPKKKVETKVAGK